MALHSLSSMSHFCPQNPSHTRLTCKNSSERLMSTPDPAYGTSNAGQVNCNKVFRKPNTKESLYPSCRFSGSQGCEEKKRRRIPPHTLGVKAHKIPFHPWLDGAGTPVSTITTMEEFFPLVLAQLCKRTLHRRSSGLALDSFPLPHTHTHTLTCLSHF